MFYRVNSLLFIINSATHIKWDKKGNTVGCHFERSEKTLESAVCGFKGFLATLEMTGFAWVVNILKMSVSDFLWVAINSFTFVNRKIFQLFELKKR